MKLRDNLIVGGSTSINIINNAEISNLSVLFEKEGIILKRTLGNIVNYNYDDLLNNINYNIPSIFTPGETISKNNPNVKFSMKSQPINTFLAAPSIGNGTPSFRRITAEDLADTGVLFSETDPFGVSSLEFTGTKTKTLTITLNNGSKKTATFDDANSIYTAGNGLTLTGTTFSLPVTDSGSGDYVTNVTASANGLTVTKATLPVNALVTSTTATGTTNVTTTNTNTYLNIVRGGTSTGSSTQVTGSGSVSVSSDANGKLTINGTNTTYGVETLANLNTGTSTTGLLQSAKNLNDWLTGKGYAITSQLANYVPYAGANKAIDLNTQILTHEGNLVKREGHFEKKLLRNGNSIASNYVKLTDVCSLSLAYDALTTGDIVITIPIKTSTKWAIEVDIDQADVLSSKLIINSYGIRNLSPKVSTVFGHDKIHSVKFCRKDDSSVIIIKLAENSTTFSYGRVNLATFYYSIAYSSALEIKSNYKIEFLKEEDIEGLTINETILNKDFDRDPYLLDFRNFTNVPNFALASNVFKKGEATNWTNANQRFSNLPNKSDDETYNKVMVLDADGKVGVKESDNALFFNKNGIVTGKMATFIDVFETNKDGVFTADFSMVGFKEPPKVIVSTETEEPASVTKSENGTYVSIFKDSITTTGCTGRVKLATAGGLLVAMVSANSGAGVKVTVEAKGLI